MSLPLANKNILITGTSRGLGCQLAQAMWSRGANLFLVARSQDKLEKLRNELLTTGHEHQTIKVIVADLSQPDALETLLKSVSQPLDILINNAAIHGPIGLSWENDWKHWETTIQVDLMTPVALCRAFLPAMIKAKKGKIINLSGGGATSSRQNFSAYAVAKTGIVRFSEILAEEVKPFNIDVNCIAPGLMNTGLLAEIIAAGPEKVGQHEYDQVQKNIQSADNNMLRAADLAVFLASERSNGITGKLISAVWDPWEKLPEHLSELTDSDIYTLRRIIPKDRGKNWE